MDSSRSPGCTRWSRRRWSRVNGRAPDRPVPAARAVRARSTCRGAAHRIGILNGVLTALDHAPGPDSPRGAPGRVGRYPRALSAGHRRGHRHPESLVDIRARLDHGDAVGAFAVVQALLGPDVLLRSGALRDELETAALRRIAHGLTEPAWPGSDGLRPPGTVAPARFALPPPRPLPLTRPPPFRDFPRAIACAHDDSR